MTNRYLAYDIETIPTDEGGEWTPPADKPDAFPPIWRHKIVSIALLGLGEGYTFKYCVSAGHTIEKSLRTERDLLESFVGAATGATILDFNGRNFDMPVIQHRALRHGIMMPFYFAAQPDKRGEISDYSREYRDRWSKRHIDLSQEMSPWGRSSGLANLCKLMGLPGKLDVDGSNVEALYREGLTDTIDRYCREDVYQTAIFFLRLLHLRGELPALHCTSRISEILGHMEESGEHPAFLAKVDRGRLLV